jgi:hypothetical protein
VLVILGTKTPEVVLVKSKIEEGSGLVVLIPTWPMDSIGIMNNRKSAFFIIKNLKSRSRLVLNGMLGKKREVDLELLYYYIESITKCHQENHIII